MMPNINEELNRLYIYTHLFICVYIYIHTRIVTMYLKESFPEGYLHFCFRLFPVTFFVPHQNEAVTSLDMFRRTMNTKKS